MPITGSTGPCVERMGTWGASDSHYRPIGSQPGLGVSGAEPAHADGTAEQSTNWRPSAVPVGRDGADTAAWLKELGDLTLAEMCARLAAHGIAIKVPALWHQLDKWKLTLKKNPTRQRARSRRLARRTA